ncbi:hypothetical protein G6F59_017916 [Rhizopus arrhizus]|nr:hypothetical protein G6F59_017916 [Rhizopus arrhizus]
MRRTFTPQGAISGLILGAALLALAGCGSAPPANITLASPTSSTPEKVGDLSTERIKWASTQRGCEGDRSRGQQQSGAAAHNTSEA